MKHWSPLKFEAAENALLRSAKPSLGAAKALFPSSKMSRNSQNFYFFENFYQRNFYARYCVVGVTSSTSRFLQRSDSVIGPVGSFVFVFGWVWYQGVGLGGVGGLVEGERNGIFLSARRLWVLPASSVNSFFNIGTSHPTGNAFWIWTLIVKAIACSWKAAPSV